MANVFLSHRDSDTGIAGRLATEIQAAGHKVWFDAWDIALGDSIVERINEGLEGANYLVICYSAAGIASPWISREWMSALANQLNGVKIKLLPVVLTGGVPPFILSDVAYADLSKDWAGGVSRLLHSIT
jgi:hypothetical protein